MINIRDDQYIMTETYVDHKGHTQQAQRKTIDFFVMLKDYKEKMTEIDSEQRSLQRWCEFLEEARSREAEDFKADREQWQEERFELVKRISTLEEQHTRIEMLEKQMFNLHHTPLKPVLVNPFD